MKPSQEKEELNSFKVPQKDWKLSSLDKVIFVLGGFTLGVMLGDRDPAVYTHIRNAGYTAAVPLGICPVAYRFINKMSWKSAYQEAPYMAPAFLVGQYARQTIDQIWT